MTLEEPRQGYFLGKIVRKAKKAVKKVVKSPLGKAALLGAGIYGLGGGFGLLVLVKALLSCKNYFSIFLYCLDKLVNLHRRFI